MSIDEIQIAFARHAQIKAVGERLKAKGEHLLLSGLHASARALALSALRTPLFVILDNEDTARYFYSDLQSLEGQRDKERSTSVFFFSHSRKRRAVDEAAQIQRTECLSALRGKAYPNPSLKGGAFRI